MLTETRTTKVPCMLANNYNMNFTSFSFSAVFGENSSDDNYHVGIEFMMPNVLLRLGSVCCKLRRYSESVSYYNWADKNLTKLLEKEESCPGKCVLKKLEITHLGFFEVKRAMGKKEEAAPHMRKVLEFKEKRLEEGCVELGKANKDVYQAYFAAVDIKGALPFCLKALEIYMKFFGSKSVEVAEIRSSLGTIYGDLDESEKAHEQLQLARSILKKVAPNSRLLLTTEIADGHTLIELRRYKEAIEVFNDVTSHTEAKGIERAGAFGGMASAYLSLGNYTDTKIYIRVAQRIYEKEAMDPICAATIFQDMSKMFEQMNDLEPAISLVRQVLSIPRIPQKLLVEACWRLFSLYSQAGKEKEGIPYKEDAVEKLKKSFGLEHREVGYGYTRLGEVYLDSVQEELAAKVLEKAKKIMDVSVGPGHLDSLVTSHYLSVTYSRLQRLKQAIEIEESVVAGLRSLGPRVLEYLRSAVGHLNKMKGNRSS